MRNPASRGEAEAGGQMGSGSLAGLTAGGIGFTSHTHPTTLFVPILAIQGSDMAIYPRCMALLSYSEPHGTNPRQLDSFTWRL